MIDTITAHGREYRMENPGGIIGKAVHAGSPYEAPVLEHIYQQDFQGIAVDAGASMGNHALWLAAICELEVYAFEPLDFTRLRSNVKLNRLPIMVCPVGLGAEECVREVTGPPMHVVGGDLESPVVRVQTLDSYELENVAVLKIDVEGMEPDVIRGATHTIRRNRPVIFAEAASRKARYRNAEVLEFMGYRLNQIFGATPLQEWLP